MPGLARSVKFGPIALIPSCRDALTVHARPLRVLGIRRVAYHADHTEGRGSSPDSLCLYAGMEMQPPQCELLVPIDIKLAELGEDGLLELMADDEILYAHDLDRITLEKVDEVRRFRTTRYG